MSISRKILHDIYSKRHQKQRYRGKKLPSSHTLITIVIDHLIDEILWEEATGTTDKQTFTQAP